MYLYGYLDSIYINIERERENNLKFEKHQIFNLKFENNNTLPSH